MNPAWAGGCAASERGEAMGARTTTRETSVASSLGRTTLTRATRSSLVVCRAEQTKAGSTGWELAREMDARRPATGWLAGWLAIDGSSTGRRRRWLGGTRKVRAGRRDGETVGAWCRGEKRAGALRDLPFGASAGQLVRGFAAGARPLCYSLSRSRLRC